VRGEFTGQSGRDPDEDVAEVPPAVPQGSMEGFQLFCGWRKSETAEVREGHGGGAVLAEEFPERRLLPRRKIKVTGKLTVEKVGGFEADAAGGSVEVPDQESGESVHQLQRVGKNGQFAGE
jgi:hypothetical protein